MSRTSDILDEVGLAGLALARGRVAGREAGGRLLVRLETGVPRDVACDVLVDRAGDAAPFRLEEEVLVAFDRRGGVILGRVGIPRTAPPMREPNSVAEIAAENREPAEEVTVSASRRVVVKAGEELVLECGSGSVRITRDGKVVIRGENILSRAKGTHRIKGGSVGIN